MMILRRRPSNRSMGQSMVEFALILPILLIVLVGMLDFGRAIFAYNSVANAARSATRIAIVNQTVSDVEDAAESEAVGLDPLTIVVEYDDGGTACSPVKLGCIASVRVSHAWMPATPLVNAMIGPITLESSAAMPVEREWPMVSP
ncbi:MAG: TadE/TadG family type IV pilus assembly protein [Candidatus Limnocylindria bacterium]